MQLRVWTATALVALVVGSTASITAASPATPAVAANDDFVDASALTLSSSVAFASNAGATKEPGEPDHAGKTGGTSLWWRVELPVDAFLEVNACPSNFDTLVGVYTGSTVSNLTPIASNDDNPFCNTGSNRQSMLTFDAKAHVPYSIAVDGWHGATGNVAVAIQIPNDAWTNRRTVGPLPVPTAGTNIATFDYEFEPKPPRGGENTVWYSYTPTTSGPITANTCKSDFDTVLGVYTGSTAQTLQLVNSNDDSPGACPNHTGS